MTRVAKYMTSRPWLGGGLVALVTLVAVGGWYVWDQVNVPDITVSYAVPTAPQLAAGDSSQTLYRIDPLESSVTYAVEEILAGVSRTANGSTQGIAGDLVIDDADPSASVLGEVMVNVQQLTSDQSLRDRRIRQDFLESGHYPLVRFVPGAIDGMPASITDGEAYVITIDGQLTVKETTAPVVLDATATRTGDEVSVTASTTVAMSTFDIGPIELIGFVRTGDEVTLDFDLTYVDPTRRTIATEVPGRSGTTTATAGGGPSFASTVQPVLTNSCASCHNDGGVGAMVWTLGTAADAAEIASGLSLVTASRFMPPWPAGDLGGPFDHNPSLSQDDIDAVVSWAAAGGELDVDPATPIVAPVVPGSGLTPDVVMALAEPYQGSTLVRNDYRCFMLDPALTDTTWVAGYEFVPDRAEVVHHALAFRIPGNERDRIVALDEAGDGSGWDCDAGVAMSNQFMGWAPGQDPTKFPDGTAMRMDAGDVVVLQIHYHFTHSAPLDQSALQFELAPAGSTPIEVGYRTYLAPAEIPCRDGIEAGPLCDRGAAIADLFDRLGMFGAIPDALLRQCGNTPDEYAAMTNGVASASCNHTIRRDVDVIAVFGHMHEIGDAFRMTLNPGTATERILLDIPAWDFGWQLNYRFTDPVALTAGDVIRVECTWDRAHLKVPENRYITWSEGTEDEMCYSALTTLPPRGQRS